MHYDDVYEEEMVRLAAEMSLMDVGDLEWDPYNLEAARDKVKNIEELVDEQLVATDNTFDSTPAFSQPISNSQIRDIFALNDTTPKGSSPALNTALQDSLAFRDRDSTDSLDRYSLYSHGHETPVQLSRRPSGIRRDAGARDTIVSLKTKLRWYQKKIVGLIQETHEHHNYADGRLAVLLEMNDYVTSVLSKVDLVEASSEEEPPVAAAMARPALSEPSVPQLHARSHSADYKKSDYISTSAAPMIQQQQQTLSTATSFPSVVSAVYALRRGGNRQETLHAVDNLIQLCNFGGELCLPAVKQMMAAGALQSLLSTLARASEWPEVEKQISKVVSILVTYEDDWALLQRSALFILTALYTLQVKTLTQCRSSAGAVAAGVGAGDGECDPEHAYRSRTASCSSQVTLPMLGVNAAGANQRWDLGVYGSSSTRNSSAPMSPTSQDGQRRRGSKPEPDLLPAREAAALAFQTARIEPPKGAPLVGIDTEVEHLLQQQQQKDKAEYLRRMQEEAEEEQENLKALLSAAVAKLSLVLASEWGKLSSPLGAFGTSAMMGAGLGGAAAAGGGLGFGLGLNMNMAGGSSRADPNNRRTGNVLPAGRSISAPIGHSQSHDLLHGSLGGGMGGAGNNRNARNSKTGTAAVENDRILQILLNLIETLADDSLNPTRTQLNTVGGGMAGTLGISAITKILVKSTAAKEVPAETESTQASSAEVAPAIITPQSDRSSLTAEPGWLPALVVPEGATRQNSATQTAAGASSINTAAEEDEILKQGAIFFSPLMRVDSAAVLCSAALCNLAEVPQCRPGLVSSGALKMIKSWLEIGNDVLAQARVLCFHKLSSPRSYNASRMHQPGSDSASGSTDDNERSQQMRESCNAFMEAFGPAYELISNAAAALMHLSGGTDCRFASLSAGMGQRNTGAASTHMLHGSGGRDYIVGWIDAQILAEGLPAVVVKILHTSVEAFTSLPEDEAVRPTRSVLPAAVGMHLAQTLYQLCSRVQNRQQLQAIDIPFALCILFENISSQTKLITDAQDADEFGLDYDDDVSGHSPTSGLGGRNTFGSGPGDRRAHNTDSIYAYIFHFGGIYTSRNKHGGHATSSQQGTPHSGGNATPGVTTLKRDNSSDFLTLYSANVDNKILHRKSMTTKGASGNRAQQPHRNSGHGNRKSSLPIAAFMKLVPEDLMPIMASITSSCLDALTFFFADEISKLPYGATSARVKSKAAGGIRSSLSNTTLDSHSYKSYYSSIVDLMCSERIIESIKMASSFLPRGAGRLATIRVISALTEWPESLTALYDGGIMDVLMLISSEAEEIQAQRNTSVKMENTRDEGVSFFSNIFPSKPQPAERNISGASSISAISSSNSTHRGGRDRSFYDRSGVSPHDYYDPSAPLDMEDEEENNARISEIALEETLSVCYALANLCEACSPYALRMFHSGLFAIMLKLVRSKHMEIGRQALRCISAMCASVSHDPQERSKYVKVKGSGNKNALFLEALEILSECLKSPSSLLQKGATHTVSLLALINEQLQDSIVEGPLRTIISMLVDPKSDRDVRAAAEEVLKNLGFRSGVKDFELCGYDFEILRDWYVMRRSQKPQDEALELLRDWVENLFSDTQSDRAPYQLHRQPGESIASANDLAHETATMLNASIAPASGASKLHHMNSGSRESFDTAAEVINYTSAVASGVAAGTSAATTAVSRLPPLSIPSLHRNFTESILRFLPFCIKSPFHESGSSATPTKYNVQDDNHDISPSAGGAQFMNRSMHPASSMINVNSPNVSTTPSGTNHITQAELYDWLDRPPLGILHLMEMFYSSKLHQLLLMDMTSLGVALSTQPPAIGDDGEPYTDAEEVACDLDIVYLLPRPHSVSAIMLPARSYQSFTRVGRVIERMVEYSDSSKMWSLIFRDSEYLGDFHTSLLSSLRRCPQICSLSFASTQRVEDDALLGHLVGQIPPTIRFISFKSTLSRESIQALCILLRTHNAAFLTDADTPKSAGGHRRGRSGGASALGKGFTDQAAKTGADPEPNRSKGLLGLALTHLTFEATEINYIIELLQQRVSRLGSTSRGQSFKSDVTNPNSGERPVNKNAGNNNSASAPVLTRGRSVSDGTPVGSDPSTPNNNNNRGGISPAASFSPGGLRFLDLSYNALNDATCARVLAAALTGPLEGLELGGNIINRGIKFAETMELFTADKMVDHRHRLRYLGLARNNLTGKAVSSLLEHLMTNNTLTGLDLSENDIDHSVASNEMFRRFLRCNTGLRALDLCHNKLGADTFKEIHLGLLENDSLLLLPMAGNHQVEVSPTVNLIQIKLRENRLLYKSQTKIDDYLTQQGKMAAYQTEEELGMRISFTDRDTLEKLNAQDLELINQEAENELLEGEEVPMVAAEALAPEDAPLEAYEPEDFHMGAHFTSQQPLKLMNPSNSRRNSNAAPALENQSQDSSADLPPSGVARASVEMSQIKVPGYSIAIAVPIDPHQRAYTNYNSDRAKLFGNSTSMQLARMQGEQSPRAATSLERKLTNPGSAEAGAAANTQSLKATASPSILTLTKSRPNSISITSGPTSLHSDVSFVASPKHSQMHGGDSTRSTDTSDGTSAAHSQSHPLLEASEKFSNNTLNVLFSAPLAGFDRNSRPHPLEMLDYTNERELLIQVFKEVHRDVSVHFDFATTDTLRTALSFGCKALHFSGHGIPKGLCFEDGRAGLQVVRVNQLRDLLGAGGLNLQFVFVSACYSMEIGEAFVKAGVPHVVCVKVDTKIQDAAAIAFTRAFYVALLSGKTVKNSFSIAKEALKSSPYVPDSLLEGAKFILLPDYSTVTNEAHLDGFEVASNHHNKVIFPSRPVVDWPMPGRHCTMGPNLIDVKTFLQSNRLPSPPADFEGREVVMHNVIRSILDRRMVSLVGEDGMGKSAVAAAVCKYLSDREMFADSIIYFRAKGIKDYRSFLSGLLNALQYSGCSSIAARIQGLLSSQSNNTSSSNLVYPEEEVIFSCLESLRMLLVMDSLDELVADYGESHTDFRLFLGRLFEQCRHVKVLVVSTDTLSMHNINVGFGIVEYSILLGPLTLISTLRLFARLAPSLSAAGAKKEFLSALQPARQLHVSVNSRDVNKTALQILELFGDGHPAKIVHMACESTQETVDKLKATGMNIIAASASAAMAAVSSNASVGGYSVSMASYASTPTTNGVGGNTPMLSTSTSYNVFENNANNP